MWHLLSSSLPGSGLWWAKKLALQWFAIVWKGFFGNCTVWTARISSPATWSSTWSEEEPKWAASRNSPRRWSTCGKKVEFGKRIRWGCCLFNSLISKSSLTTFSALLSVQPKLFRVRKAFHRKVRFFSRNSESCQKNIALSSLGRQWIRSTVVDISF